MDVRRFLNKLVKPCHLIDGYPRDNCRDISRQQGDVRKLAKLFYRDVGEDFCYFSRRYESDPSSFSGQRLNIGRSSWESGSDCSVSFVSIVLPLSCILSDIY